MDMSERIKSRRLYLGLTQEELGLKLGLQKSAIAKYENGRVENIKRSVIAKMAEVLECSPAYLMGWSDEINPAPALDLSKFDNIYPVKLKKFPLLGEIACGKPIFANEDRESYILAGSDIHADFCLRAKGDSMINARILDGDIVFIRKQDMVDNGEIAAVAIGDYVTLKRVFYHPEQDLLILKAENSKYQDMIYAQDQLDQVYILGKAIAFQSDVK
ncbi:LexA family protein [Anaerotignum lactatifermentans]|uniref:LexA family protein n=1 Tax=Anaerotignum lactatifermentans TaxID=160404 RepID=UPI003AB8132B